MKEVAGYLFSVARQRDINQSVYSSPAISNSTSSTIGSGSCQNQAGLNQNPGRTEEW